MVAAYRATFAKLRAMKADVLLAPHDNFFDLEARRARQLAGDANAFVDPHALGRLNEEMAKAFEKALWAPEGRGELDQTGACPAGTRNSAVCRFHTITGCRISLWKTSDPRGFRFA